ncbi:SusC/RagA family TonB-linked outer membrane protein [Pontibacter cellulosilyticus]|uniref:SusC/RagA family TonB-linked outer membrane protein n=1 Tax=Pontibacter cellulosilyticus TaxID=1720253 RepID=A0A923N4P4_9BACT|nr:SusC/RagA family TonB-linked outer membrane protein [Pontibacter cellulosilyticus]MBC5992850.1 SusC/RagA family TonB-linked outer membrane protein [Pontibacter cellulosilyticus]
MKKSLLFSLFFVLVMALPAWAQQSRTVNGKVTDQATGQGLPGVAVLVKGTTVGTTTAADGAYSINVPADKNTLVFRYIGYNTQEVPVGNSGSVNVTLSVNQKQLEEVVVVGYSTTTQQSFTGTAKVVSAEKLESKSVSNVSQALAGEVAGVRVINTSGQPGTASTIRIRGIGSVNGNRAPLYVVDGVPFSGGLNSINPADIESTTVLKDAAATAIYGSRGANGVIVITTKSGRGKKSFIEADANFGTNMALLPRYETIKSPEQYIALGWEGLYNRGVAINNADPVKYANDRLFSTSGVRTGYNLWNVANGGELIDPLTRSVRPGVTRKYDPENWEDYAFQNSARREYNVKFGGSSGKTSFYSSFGYLDDVGYSINSDYERLTGRVNLRQEIKEWLTGGINISYARSETNTNGQTSDSGSIFWFVDNMPSIYPLFRRDAEGNIIEDPIYGGPQYDYGAEGNFARGFGGLTNSIADATYNTRRDNRDEINGNANLDFTILKGLTFENRLGLQYYHNKYGWLNNKFYGSAAGQQGALGLTRTDRFSYNLLNMLRYNTAVGQHGVEVLAAHEASNFKQNVFSASGYRLVVPDLLELSNAVVKNPTQNSYTDEYALESYFTQVNYDYAKKYFISATLRRDGSSRFRDDKWSNFGSVGTAWVVSNEDFMSSQNVLSNLKLKASYGLIGDQAGVGYYPGYDLYSVDNVNNQPGFALSTPGNRALTWETSKMFQTGVEFGLGNYLEGSIDYYIKNTDDLIFDVRTAPSTGIAIMTSNAGTLQNRGLEFDLVGHLVKKNDFRLDLSVNGEKFTNKITEMPIDPSTGKPKAIDVQGVYAWSEGHSVFDYYLREFAGVNPENGTSLWTVNYIDANSNGSYDKGEGIGNLTDYLSSNPDKANSIMQSTTDTYADATLKYNGKSAIPDVRGAVNLDAGFKGFDLRVQMLYSFGGYAYDGAYASLMHSGLVGSNNWHVDILNRWQQEGDITDVPRLSNELDKNVSSASTRFLTKANYLVLNNVRLSYTLPSSYTSKFGLGGLSVWVSGDNLWINTARKGFNPSTAETGASSTYRYSPLSTVTAGLRVRI